MNKTRTLIEVDEKTQNELAKYMTEVLRSFFCNTWLASHNSMAQGIRDRIAEQNMAILYVVQKDTGFGLCFEGEETGRAIARVEVVNPEDLFGAARELAKQVVTYLRGK